MGTDPPRVRGGSLKVVTTNLRPGYLRKNGVPYSAKAVLTEYWDVFKRTNGEEWLTITTQIEDPQYLRVPRIVGLVLKYVAPPYLAIVFVAVSLVCHAEGMDTPGANRSRTDP